MTAKTVLHNVIAGAAAAPVEGRYEDLIDPATGEVFASAPISGKPDEDRAMAEASAAFEKWRNTTPSERQQALLKFADAIEARAGDLVAAESQNTGKPLGLTASEELPPAIDQIRFFAGAARLLEGRSAGEYLTGYESYVRREPIGVCAQVTPWNYPLMMAVWKFAPALAAGNVQILKPAETTPLTTLRFFELAMEAEILPPGVLNVITGDGVPVGEAIVKHPDVRLVSLTGDVETGKIIARTAADNLKRVHLELGGKAPVIETCWGVGWLTSARPVSRSPTTTLSTPGGRNSAAISAISSVEAGVVSEGLSTTVLPAAMAGAHFQTAIISG